MLQDTQLFPYILSGLPKTAADFGDPIINLAGRVFRRTRRMLRVHNADPSLEIPNNNVTGPGGNTLPDTDDSREKRRNLNVQLRKIRGNMYPKELG